MVWGCMTSKGIGYLTKIDGGLDSAMYCDILKGELRQTIEFYGLEDFVFQHDNDPKHTARVTQACIAENNLEVLQWPAQSPDLNPIEYMWHVLKQKLGDHELMPTSMHELWLRVQHEWESINVDDCMKLIETMPKRLEAVMKAKGGNTKY